MNAHKRKKFARIQHFLNNSKKEVIEEVTIKPIEVILEEKEVEVQVISDQNVVQQAEEVSEVEPDNTTVEEVVKVSKKKKGS